jgi:hypothetical protein
LGVLLPHLADVLIDRVEEIRGTVWLWARPRARAAICTGCGQDSVRVHSRYERRVADAAVAGWRVVLRVRVRRFVCGIAGCPVKTFAEQIEGLTTRYGRRSVPLAEMVTAIGVALAGRAGSRLAARLGLATGRNVLLRLVRGLPDPQVGAVSVLGVDDFALRRNRRYGTILIDMSTHRPVDVLADRQADTFADWLREHPGTTVVCRDRASAYAEGARAGAPEAIQVADRWHLWHNLAEQVEKTVAAHHGCLREPEIPTEVPAADLVAAAEEVHAARRAESGLVARSTARFEQVQALKAQGKNITTIMVNRPGARRGSDLARRLEPCPLPGSSMMRPVPARYACTRTGCVRTAALGWPRDGTWARCWTSTRPRSGTGSTPANARIVPRRPRRRLGRCPGQVPRMRRTSCGGCVRRTPSCGVRMTS